MSVVVVATIVPQGPALAALRSQLAGKIIGPAEVIVFGAVPAGDLVRVTFVAQRV